MDEFLRPVLVSGKRCEVVRQLEIRRPWRVPSRPLLIYAYCVGASWSDVLMLDRIFKNVLNKDLALQRLGSAVVLQWSALSAPAQEAIVQQALAMADHDVRVSEQINAFVGRDAKGVQLDASPA